MDWPSDAWSFEPQTDAVPHPAEKARRSDVGESDQRKLPDRLAVERDLDRADALAARDRSEERLLGLEHELQLLRLPLRERNVLVGDETRRHLVLGTLPNPDRRNRLSVLVELDGIVELEAVVQELLRLARARSVRPGPEHHRQQPSRPALRRRDKTVPGGVGEPGLHAVDVRVAPQQSVAIGL